MSDYILCQVKRASLPFYVENISKNIYSIEELCYYFYKNIYLIDESIINERLCNWLKDELGLSKLYAVPDFGKRRGNECIYSGNFP